MRQVEDSAHGKCPCKKDVESVQVDFSEKVQQAVHLCNAGYYNSKLGVDSARNHDADHVAGHGFGAWRSDFVRTSGERENDGVSRRFCLQQNFLQKTKKVFDKCSWIWYSIKAVSQRQAQNRKV